MRLSRTASRREAMNPCSTTGYARCKGGFATLGALPVDDATETITPRSLRAELPKVNGVVAVYAEGEGAISRPIAVQTSVVVGRSVEADLTLPDKKASRRHAELSPAAGGVMVADLGSRNGTAIDGASVGGIAANAPVGSVLRVGRSLLVVVDDVAAHAHGLESSEAMVGGPALAKTRQQIRHAARSTLPTLIQGESGVGKELVAEAIHQAGDRSGRLVAVNCAAIPDQLIEAELFGHAKGAFSGAEMARQGLLRSAHGGTLFLDEIGEMPIDTQAKLLRALETGEVRPVGEDRLEPVDLRFVAATHAALEEDVEQGRFRGDLFHRIAAIRIVVPALRDRREDIPRLVMHFAAAPDGGRWAPSAAALDRLMRWRWPGNVRELKNAVGYAVQAARDDGARDGIFDVDHLPEHLEVDSVSTASGNEDTDSTPNEERRRYDQALRSAKGNVAEVARRLGMRRATVYEHLRRLAMDPADYRT
jgi:DNA-binding NtrC family response regulator